jgi:hypothetical protein
MTVVSAFQVTSGSDRAQASFPQVIDITGLKSRRQDLVAIGQPSYADMAVSVRPADSAGRDAAVSWRRRYQEWMRTGVAPRTGADLFARLPFDDAMKLAALIGIGRMTWPEIHAALDAAIKLAVTDATDEKSDERRASPARIAEDEIWARYHAQCDELFASDASLPDVNERSREQLWRRERILDRLRSARDRDLTASHRRMEAEPRSPLSAVTSAPLQATTPWTDLSPAECAALYKLDATGFVGSAGMRAAIKSLVAEIADMVPPGA